MRTRLLVAFGLVACTLFALGTPASAGMNMHVEVNKVVVGSPPPGTTFTVHYACNNGGPEGDLTFDAGGNPVPANDNFFNDSVLGSTCTITETATGGASVAYTCEDDGVNASCAASGNEVTFDSPTNNSNTVIFTVTNTFTEPTPGTTAPESAAATPAAAVVGTPQFTG
jgi:hypothetical protein